MLSAPEKDSRLEALAAIRAFGAKTPPDAVPLVVKMLDDDELYGPALKAFIAFPREVQAIAVAHLVEMLDDLSPDFRAAAASALASFPEHSKSIVPALAR